MHFIVGLGNPGSEYLNTRHNLGFIVVERIAEDLKLRFREGKGDYRVALGSFKSKEIGLAKPLTYMNNSGDAVADILEKFAVPLNQLLVVCDDFQLQLGTLRLRHQGSDGGHNGLYSVIYRLGSDQFPRLRCGIATEKMSSNKSLMKDFVLEDFASDELPRVSSMVDRAKDACLCFIQNGIEQTMNLYNQKQAES